MDADWVKSAWNEASTIDFNQYQIVGHLQKLKRVNFNSIAIQPEGKFISCHYNEIKHFRFYEILF